MTDRIPPVVAEGCAWMPWRASDQVNVVCARWTGGEWRHLRWKYLSAPGDVPDFRIMRRLGPEEDPWEGCYTRSAAGWAPVTEGCDSDLRETLPGVSFFAPVRFAGKVPDFGEGGLRLADESEVVDEHGCVPTEQGPALPITLPPLPRPEHDDPGVQAVQDMVDTEAARVVAGLEMESFDDLRAENERLRARLREVEAERNKAQARLARMVEAVRKLGRPGYVDAKLWLEFERIAERIADGEV